MSVVREIKPSSLKFSKLYTSETSSVHSKGNKKTLFLPQCIILAGFLFICLSEKLPISQMRACLYQHPASLRHKKHFEGSFITQMFIYLHLFHNVSSDLCYLQMIYRFIPDLFSVDSILLYLFVLYFFPRAS